MVKKREWSRAWPEQRKRTKQNKINKTMSPPPPDEAETGWTRLAAVWEAATARVEPGDPVRRA